MPPGMGGNRYDVLEDGTFQRNWNNNQIYTDRWCIYMCWGSGRASPSPLRLELWAWAVGPMDLHASGGNQLPHRLPDQPVLSLRPRISVLVSAPSRAARLRRPLGRNLARAGFYNYLYSNRALYSNASVYNGYGDVMVFGMGSGQGSNDPCWRDLYAGDIATYMTDPDNPTLDPISGYPTAGLTTEKK